MGLAQQLGGSLPRASPPLLLSWPSGANARQTISKASAIARQGSSEAFHTVTAAEEQPARLEMADEWTSDEWIRWASWHPLVCLPDHGRA